MAESNYKELSAILNRLEVISKIMPLVISYCEVKKEYYMNGGNITVYAPRVFTMYQMFLSAYDRISSVDTKLQEAEILKDTILENNEKVSEYYRKSEIQITEDVKKPDDLLKGAEVMR